MSAWSWNPWHGCKKYSEGCLNCYVYRRDASVGRDASIVARTKDFDWPLRRRRDGSFVLPAGAHVYACMTSDFFLPEADAWRAEAWECIRARPDVSFHHHHQAHTAHGGVPAAGLGRGLCKRGDRPHLRKPAPRRRAHGGVSAPAHPQPLRHLRAAAGARWTSPHGWTRASAKWWPAANPARTPGKCATSGRFPCASSACAPAWASTSSRRARTLSRMAAATASSAPCRCRRRKKPASTFPGFHPRPWGYQ